MNVQNCSNKDEITIILEKIALLQKEAVREKIQEKYCDFGFLGDSGECNHECNTRPIMIYTDEDTPWHCPIDREEGECSEGTVTCIFRVEKVENCAVVLRALVKNINAVDCQAKYYSTNSYITIKLAKIAALRCLKDTFVDLCIR